MKYLFFDIECADGNKAICEFGYVITNEKCEILKERNLIVDPECKFHLTGREGQDDLELTYPYDYYKKFYPLPDVYEDIKTILTQKDTIVFGHAVNNDIGFIFKDCKHYHLPLFEFTAYDVQKMLPVFDKANQRYTSLDKAYKALVAEEIQKTLLDHRACDDAKKTMLVFKAMVETLGFKAEDLIASCPKSKIEAIGYWEQKKILDKDRKIRKANGKRRKLGQVMWGELYREHLSLLEKEESVGKLVTVSGELKENHQELRNVISIMREKGYVAFDKITGSDFLITFDDKNKNEMVNAFKYPYGGKVVTYEEFISLYHQNKL